MTAFLDTAVFMYAGGADHPFRTSCRTILRRAAMGEFAATTSTEVVQEILHRYLSIRPTPDGPGDGDRHPGHVRTGVCPSPMR